MADFPVVKTEYNWMEVPVFDPTLRTIFSSGDTKTRLIIDPDDLLYQISFSIRNLTYADLIKLEIWEGNITVNKDVFDFVNYKNDTWTLYLTEHIEYSTIKPNLFNANIKCYGVKN